MAEPARSPIPSSSSAEAISFREFMQRALYDPQRGYYTSRIKTVGARGDFSTSPTLSPVLGQAIAAWLRAEMKRTGIRKVIEIGGGSGALMTEVRRSLGWWSRWQTKLWMVETSPVLAGQQRQFGVSVVATLPEALAACGGEAILYSNELLDAFPVDLVQWHEDTWHEVWLRNGVEDLHPLTLDAKRFSALRSRPTMSQRCELHATVRDWLAQWIPQWKRGSMLTIDYGNTFPALYHRRSRGTLRAYLLQQRFEGADVYANPGRQDITCDVNFTDVRDWLVELGTTECSYETQASFITRWLPKVRRDAAHADADAAFRCVVSERG